MVLLQNYAPSVNYNRTHLGFVVCVYKSRFFPGIPGLNQTLSESRIFFPNREIPNPSMNGRRHLIFLEEPTIVHRDDNLLGL